VPDGGEYTETYRRSKIGWYRLHAIICEFGWFLIIKNQGVCIYAPFVISLLPKSAFVVVYPFKII
jgi:hypothetical protein